MVNNKDNNNIEKSNQDDLSKSSKKEVKKESDFEVVKKADAESFQFLTRKQKKIYKREQKHKALYGVSYMDLFKDENKQTVQHNKKMLNRYWTNKKGYFVIIILLYLLIIGVSILPPILLSRYINYMTGSLWENAIMAVAVYAVLVLFQITISALNDYITSKLMIKSIFNLREDLTNKIIRTQYDTFKTLGTGRILSRLSSDANTYVTCVENSIANLTELLSNAIFTIYLTILSPLLASVFIGMSLLKMISNLTYNNTIMKRQIKTSMALSDKRSSTYNEMAKGILDSKFLNIEENLGNQVNKWNVFQKNNQLHRINHSITFNWIVDLFFTIGFCLFLYLSVKQLSIGAVTLGTVVVFFSYRNNVIDLFKKIIDINKNNLDKRIASNRICEILDNKEFPMEIFGNKELQNFNGEIKFVNVSFNYQNERDILKNINLTIKPNELIGFVGKSGAGKSTIVSLIPRIYDVSNGQILLDGQDVKTLTKESLRNNIALVSQSPYIFNLSFKDNLTLVKPDATEDELIAVCKKARLYDTIMSRPDGLNTILGEGGLQLSGGQKQRLAIARALLKESKVLIFDEATSALDNENQFEIQKIINELSHNHTIIIIAHRLSTVVNCDKLIMIENGEIIGSGTHKEMMQNNEIYASLYKYESNL